MSFILLLLIIYLTNSFSFVNNIVKCNVNYNQLYQTNENDGKPGMDPDMALSRIQEVAGSTSEQLLKSFNIFSDGLRKSGFKQAVANTLAGEYNDKIIRENLEEEIKSAPCVIFGWSVSPFTKKAIENFQAIGVRMKVIYLDQPWEEGNPKRAELGKMVGRTSVPFVYIGGEYIGGMDDGPTFEAPGVLKLAIQGKLRGMLIKAGALDKDYSVDL